MSWLRLIDVVCDSCFKQWDGTANTVGDARHQAREDGWRFRKGRDLCPACAGTEVEDEGWFS